jgi:hypothetical protein
MIMGGVGKHRRVGFRLTAWGWVLAVALVVLVVLAVVVPSNLVIVGLAAVILLWAWLLNSSFASTQARGMLLEDVGRTDYGRAAAEEHGREHGHRI